MIRPGTFRATGSACGRRDCHDRPDRRHRLWRNGLGRDPAEAASRELHAECERAQRVRARAPWSYDTSAIPEAVRNYDPSMFTKASAATAVTSPAAPALAKAPDPLPAAADAYRGIQLMCLAEDLPPMTRSDAKNAFTVGPYRMQPVVRAHEDGSVSLLYWVAVNQDAKRGEFVVGPGELETFKANVTAYARAGATTYMNGEPNEWQRQSLKTVDDAMRKGTMWGLQFLNRAWLATVQDPNFWGQNLLNIATAAAGAGAAGRVEAELEEEAPKKLPQGPGPHSPTVEGGLNAHEGGPARAHTIRKHIGKTEAELRARYTVMRTAR